MNPSVEVESVSDKLILRELSRYQLGTFADIIYRNAILYPDSEAFVCGPERVSFKCFNERVNSSSMAFRPRASKRATSSESYRGTSWNTPRSLGRP